MKIIFFAIYIILITSYSYSQDTINLMSGKQIVAKSIFNEPSSTLLKFDIVKKNKVIQKDVDKLDIFSINYADKSQVIFYFQDSVMGNKLSVSDMSCYILGEREAIKYYKSPYVLIGGFATGALAVKCIGFWGVLSPIVYGTAMGIIEPKVKASEDINPYLRDNKNFINGYKDAATKKKFKTAIKGAVIGVIASSITSIIINATK